MEPSQTANMPSAGKAKDTLPERLVVQPLWRPWLLSPHRGGVESLSKFLKARQLLPAATPPPPLCDKAGPLPWGLLAAPQS